MAKRSRLTFKYTRTSELSQGELDELWSLHDRHFTGERATFERSLRQADEVLRYRAGPGGALVGMGLVRAYPAEHEGRSFRVIWTGTVVLDPEWRGHNAIQAAGLWRLFREKVRHPLAPIYWRFDAASVQSYLLLARNFVEYWPRPDTTERGWEAGALDELCRAQCGDLYDPRTGLIAPRGRAVKEAGAETRTRAGDPDPHARYFARVNPRAALGEGLACLCPLHAKNIVHLGVNIVRRLWQRRARGDSPSVARSR